MVPVVVAVTVLLTVMVAPGNLIPAYVPLAFTAPVPLMVRLPCTVIPLLLVAVPKPWKVTAPPLLVMVDVLVVDPQHVRPADMFPSPLVFDLPEKVVAAGRLSDNEVALIVVLLTKPSSIELYSTSVYVIPLIERFAVEELSI